MDDRDTLLDALKFHGHRCWASVAGVRVGLAALRMLGVKRSGGTQLYTILETGEEHGGMCFGDGVEHTTIQFEYASCGQGRIVCVNGNH